MDNSIRSVKVPAGSILFLCENDNFGGLSLQISTDKNTLDSDYLKFNNKTSSIRVR